MSMTSRVSSPGIAEAPQAFSSAHRIPLYLVPANNGITLAPWEFDEAHFEPGFRYELIFGVLIVNPAPLLEERDPNGELEYLLRSYRKTHPEGKALDATASEHDVIVGANRRRVDRAIWCGLGRLPRRTEVPTICVEFVSEGRRSQDRDYREKRNEYKSVGVREYWIIDRFSRHMHVIRFDRDNEEEFIVDESANYHSPQMPGFELPVGDILSFADRWSENM